MPFNSAIARLAILIAAIGIAIAVPRLVGSPPSTTILLLSVPLLGVLALLAAIDIETLRLPDVLTLPLIAAGPLSAWVLGWTNPLMLALGAAAGLAALSLIAAVYLRYRKREGLGFGDAKLLAAAGGWVGVEPLPTVLLWATACALAVVAVAMVHSRTADPTTRIAFGPFLALGFWLVWLYGPIG